jgi:protein SCO1/2
LYFGYTQCPDECPLTMANARWAIAQLEADGERVNIWPVDPANDSLGCAACYLDRFHRGSSGPRDPANSYQACLATACCGNPNPITNTPMSSARVYLIDPAGI